MQLVFGVPSLLPSHFLVLCILCPTTSQRKQNPRDRRSLSPLLCIEPGLGRDMQKLALRRPACNNSVTIMARHTNCQRDMLKDNLAATVHAAEEHLGKFLSPSILALLSRYNLTQSSECFVRRNDQPAPSDITKPSERLSSLLFTLHSLCPTPILEQELPCQAGGHDASDG